VVLFGENLENKEISKILFDGAHSFKKIKNM
jgi:hypothetical protein